MTDPAAIAAIILSTSELRELLERGAVDVHRVVRPDHYLGWLGQDVQHGRRNLSAGQSERLWVREQFATEKEGRSIKVRYTADAARASKEPSPPAWSRSARPAAATAPATISPGQPSSCRSGQAAWWSRSSTCGSNGRRRRRTWRCGSSASTKWSVRG